MHSPLRRTSTRLRDSRLLGATVVLLTAAGTVAGATPAEAADTSAEAATTPAEAATTPAEAATSTVAIRTVVAGTPAGAAAVAGDRQAAFAAAARRYGVPLPVLLGVSYLESRWDHNGGRPSTDAGFGPMHLTDAAAVLAAAGAPEPRGDARGDTARPFTAAATRPVAALPARLSTVTRAATLTGLSAATLRSDPAANIAGGAALLADDQRRLGAGASADPADWYGAVARYSGAGDDAAAAGFADEVYGQIAAGASRTTDDGRRVTLSATPVRPDRSVLPALGLRHTSRAAGLDCPASLDCESVPAPYAQTGPTAGDYGNHDRADRPRSQSIDYIVIHDTETTYATALQLVQDPAYLSWHYTIRSADGHVAQHVDTGDVGWHAGNWYVNAKSVGIEHEGFAASYGAWYTEALYRSSAKLVAYLARRYGIPLDRAHILGHDNVPGTVPATVAGMHWDPGPYWDWAHYFDLIGAPFTGRRTDTGQGQVLIDPYYGTHQPVFTGCTSPGVACAPHGSSALPLHTAPSADSPLVTDIGLRPDGAPSTTDVSDHGARASSGQRYAVAGSDGDWVAIWHLGARAWFRNPANAPVARFVSGRVVTPKPGRTSVPVYGRAYPEASAYPADVAAQPLVPLQYTLGAGQRYTVAGRAAAEYYRAVSFDDSAPSDHTVIRGRTTYYEIQFGHRVMYVDAADVDLVPSRS